MQDKKGISGQGSGSREQLRTACSVQRTESSIVMRTNKKLSPAPYTLTPAKPRSLIPSPQSLLLLFVLCSFFIPHFSFAETNYFISHDENEEVIFVQRLTWPHTDYVLRYVAVIEQFNRNVFTQINRIETKENHIEVTLGAGRYRYRIEVYDLFDILYHTSSWLEFEIIRAYQPEISGFSPGGFYLDEDDTWAVTLRGRNLLPNAEYYLTRGNTKLNPETITAEGSTARLTFSEISLIPGKYEIYAKNPGGMETQQGTFTIGYRKPLDFNISLMYAPLIPVHGYLFKGTEPQTPFADFIYPLSGGLKANIQPFKRPWGYMGAELTASYTYLANETEKFSTTGNLINTHLSFIFQKYFRKKTFGVNAGIGAGATLLMQTVFDYPVGNPSENYAGLYPSIIGSLGFSIFIKKPFYITLGADYILAFPAPEDGNTLGFARPFAGIGMQF